MRATLTWLAIGTAIGVSLIVFSLHTFNVFDARPTDPPEARPVPTLEVPVNGAESHSVRIAGQAPR